MNEKRETLPNDNPIPESNNSGIGTGKKVGLYGCAFLVAAFVIMLIVLIITGMYQPFPSNEGVGP